MISSLFRRLPFGSSSHLLFLAIDGCAYRKFDPGSAPRRIRVMFSPVMELLQLIWSILSGLFRSRASQQHSVRGFLAGTVKRKLGFSLTSSKAAGDVRRYRIKARRGS